MFLELIKRLGRLTDSSLMWDVLLGPTYNRRILSAAGDMFHTLAKMFSPIPPDSRVLDVGCGPGHFTRILSRCHPGALVTGVDYSAGQVLSAQRWQAKDPAPNCRFRQANAMDLPFEDQSFDLAVSLFSLKHWPDILQGLREIHRVLKPRGRALVGEVDPQAHPESIRQFANGFTDTWWLPNSPYRLWLQHGVLPKGCTGTKLDQLSRQAGFSETTWHSRKDWILVWVDLVR